MQKKTLLYYYLISTVLNLVFIFSLSFFKENTLIQDQKVDVNVQFVSLTEEQVLQGRSIGDTDQSQYITSIEEKSTYRKYLNTRTYKSIIRELAMRGQDADFIEYISKNNPENMSSIKSNQGSNVKASSPKLTSNNLERQQGYDNSISDIEISNVKGNIKIDNSKAVVNKADNSLSGYYNISLIRYKDNVDEITKNALYQLAGAMNNWTNVKTQVMKTQIRLDDPGLLNMPIIYIALARPFSFSDRERQNLRRFFANGGFLIFSNVARSYDQKIEVDNSLGLELWKILGEFAHNLVEISRDHPIYSSFFDLTRSALPNILGISLDGRIIMVYEDSDYGNAWASGRSGKDKPYLEMGVNIITYALITNSDMIKK